ncbi:MAG: hypothetical protein QOI63_140, partial [Thermoplasmata archaeon]|nr:hypothetical protein [Thermoplasmata archaeon]
MSAWIVAKLHIDALVRTALEGPEGCGGGPNRWEAFCYYEPTRAGTGDGPYRHVTEKAVDEVGALL